MMEIHCAISTWKSEVSFDEAQFVCRCHESFIFNTSCIHEIHALTDLSV